MLNVRLVSLVTLAFSSLLRVPQSNATPAENTAETMFQIDFHVSESALRPFIPDGWTLAVATQGAIKDCNLRLDFIDRMASVAADGSSAVKGPTQFVVLRVPVKKPNSDQIVQVVIGGLTADASEAPGPFGVYKYAEKHSMQRITSAEDGRGIKEQSTWSFSAATGEKIQAHIEYERTGSRWTSLEFAFISASDPTIRQKVRTDLGISDVWNANVPVEEGKVAKKVKYKVSGGVFGKLFDGTERVLSLDVFSWYLSKQVPN
jgi:hypothetical protein